MLLSKNTGCPSKCFVHPPPPLLLEKKMHQNCIAPDLTSHTKILVEANALYDTKFAKTIVKKSLCKLFSRFCKALIQRKKRRKKYQQRLKKQKKIERILN